MASQHVFSLSNLGSQGNQSLSTQWIHKLIINHLHPYCPLFITWKEEMTGTTCLDSGAESKCWYYYPTCKSINFPSSEASHRSASSLICWKSSKNLLFSHMEELPVSDTPDSSYQITEKQNTHAESERASERGRAATVDFTFQLSVSSLTGMVFYN